ncbi:hypothetical protein HY404_04055 [Candidatus Microgenomates bacterium]|nr:hypothetical protein [Candidatus Microgenomates bacterium]
MEHLNGHQEHPHFINTFREIKSILTELLPNDKKSFGKVVLKRQIGLTIYEKELPEEVGVAATKLNQDLFLLRLTEAHQGVATPINLILFYVTPDNLLTATYLDREDKYPPKNIFNDFPNAIFTLQILRVIQQKQINSQSTILIPV